MEVRDAATVMLLRDSVDGRLEVLLLQRNRRSDFVGGAHVFPGGAVDPGDRSDAWEPRCLGLTDQEASARLGLARGGLAFWVAAMRECFEEAGVLLARHPGDEHVLSFLVPAVAARFVALRSALLSGRPFADVLAEEGLGLDAGRLHYVSHWITPAGATRRYDTRFFVAAAPAEQVPLHDDGETVATSWTPPQDALDRSRGGELQLVLPTVRNLEALCPFDTVEDVLVAAAAVEHVPTIRPRLISGDAGTRILLPGDPGYAEAAEEGGAA